MNRDIEQLVTEYTGKLEKIFVKQANARFNELVAGLTNGRKQVTPKGRMLSGKRSPEELEKAQAKILTYVAKNPGQRCEEIARGMGANTDELALPLRKMLGDTISAKGVARGRRYWAK